MANGDVQQQVSAEYLAQFNLPIGVSGMQKLQSFPQLQVLGYNGQLGSMKNDFHGLQDFKSQMQTFSSVSTTLKIAWNLIKNIVPNNISIARMLISPPGLGSVGSAFQSISGFGQVFSLQPGDLATPATVKAKVSVYQNASTQTDVVSSTGSTTLVGGGSGLSNAANANQLNGIQLVGTPTLVNNTLKFDGTNLIWGPASGGGGGGGTISINNVPVTNPDFVDGDDAKFHVSGSNIEISVDGGSY